MTDTPNRRHDDDSGPTIIVRKIRDWAQTIVTLCGIVAAIFGGMLWVNNTYRQLITDQSLALSLAAQASMRNATQDQALVLHSKALAQLIAEGRRGPASYGYFTPYVPDYSSPTFSIPGNGTTFGGK